MPSARDFLLRGLLAGLLAGLVAFGVAFVTGEPSVAAAIAVEESTATHAADHADGHGPTSGVPRSLQSTLGLLTGTALLGVTLGGLVGVLSALAAGRFGRLGPRATTLLVAAVGFVAVSAVPFLRYPPNPPAVGQSDTIGIRTALFFVLMAISVIAAVMAVLGGRWLSTRIDPWYAGLAAAAGYLVTLAVAFVIMPSFDEVPSGFPADLLYEFRTASLLTQFALWATLGVVLAELVHRLTRPTPARSQRDLVSR